MERFIEYYIEKLHEDIQCNEDVRNCITLMYHLAIMNKLIELGIIYLNPNQLKKYGNPNKRIKIGDKFKFVLNTINDYENYTWYYNRHAMFASREAMLKWPNSNGVPLQNSDSGELIFTGYKDPSFASNFPMYAEIDKVIQDLGVSNNNNMDKIHLLVNKIYDYILNHMYLECAIQYNVGNIYKI